MLLAEGFDWSQLLQDKGIAVVALIAIGAGFWRVFRFAAPICVRLAEGHSNLMETLQTTLVSQAQSAEEHSAKLDLQGQKLDEHGKRLSDIQRSINGVPCAVGNGKPVWPTPQNPPLQPQAGG